MHIELSVSGQRLRREMGPGIVGGSRYYLTAHVAFAGHDWDGCQVWLRIDKDGAQNTYLLDADGCVTADSGINLPFGQYTMSLMGMRDNMRITTNEVPLSVMRSGADGGDPLPEIPQTAAEQIALLAQEAVDTARSVREDADAGMFNGKDGAPGKAGVSAEHQWDGSVLTITSASGTSSADLRGPQGPEGKQGPQGQAGKDAPQDAVRYGVQALDEAQQAQARANIGAGSAGELSRLKGDYEQLVNKQTSLNLLDESAMIENQTIYSSGETGQGQGSWLTPSMEVGGLNKLTIHVLSGTTTTFRYCFYTEDNTPLGAVMGLNANGNATVDVPSTAKYFRFTLPNALYTNAKANGMMVQSGDTFTKYEPYGAYIASMVYPSSEVIVARGTYANLNDRLNSIPSGGGGEVNHWKGKVVAFLGDSITCGYGSNDNPYWKQLASKYEFTAHGYGVNGADSNGLYSQAQTMFAELGQTVDAVFILCGTNNFKAGGAVGDSFYTESDNTRTIRITGTNFKGSLNQLINYLKKNLPTKQIIIMTPLHRGYFHNSAETQPTELQKNSGGFWFDEYVNAVREASKVWSIPCIDLNADCGLYPMLEEHAQLYFVDATNDQLHPNELGHSRIADCIGEKLKTIFV